MLNAVDISKSYQRGLSLSKRNRNQALQNVNLSFSQNKIWGIAGQSGSGKSTLARMLAGLERPDRGYISFDDRNIAGSSRDLKAFHKEVQLVFQNPYQAMNPRFQVRDIIGEGQDNYFRLSRNSRQNRISQLLELVGLDESYLERYPHQLSGGQRQRVVLARALALEPRYLILDEVVSSLDVVVQAQVLNLLAQLKERLNLTYIFVSHDLELMEHFCDHLIIMFQGRVLEIMEKPDFNTACHPYTVLLSSFMNPSAPRETEKAMSLAQSFSRDDGAAQACVYQPYCRFAVDSCRLAEPALQIRTGGMVACIKGGC